jgi:arylsulfatase A-like enzyme
MNRCKFIKSLGCGVGALLLTGCTSLTTASRTVSERPNILIIFSDDQGYADLACYGSKTNKTPNLDQLAKEGIRFTNFYAQAICGASRSALLTGRYPVRSLGPSMEAAEITFAEMMREVGYQTACIGKWDVSNRKAIIERMPNAQGFGYYYGTLGANDLGDVKLYENNNYVGHTQDMGCLTNLYTDKAIDYLKNKRDPNKPFVLYLAHTMMHTNIDASPAFQGKSAGGLYGDVVEEFDYETGRLLKVIDDLSLRDNTLVIYTTDNGPWNQQAHIEKKRNRPSYIAWKEKHANFKNDDIFWGDAGPLRDGKGSPYEAGSRVPCIIRWPGKVPQNEVSDAIFATIDFLPTFADLAGATVPDDRIIDGVNQTDLLLGKNKVGARDNFLYQENGIRQGKWKYLKAIHKVRVGSFRDNTRKKVEELYDLEADIGETNNLADKYPERVAELKELFEKVIAGKK